MKRSIAFTILVTCCALACETKKEEPAPVAPVATPVAVPTPAPAPVQTAAPDPGPDLKVAQEAAELANKIEQTPAEAEKILTAAGTSREQFLERLYTIAEDPLLSAEYARHYQPKQAG